MKTRECKVRDWKIFKEHFSWGRYKSLNECSHLSNQLIFYLMFLSKHSELGRLSIMKSYKTCKQCSLGIWVHNIYNIDLQANKLTVFHHRANTRFWLQKIYNWNLKEDEFTWN